VVVRFVGMAGSGTPGGGLVTADSGSQWSGTKSAVGTGPRAATISAGPGPFSWVLGQTSANGLRKGVVCDSSSDEIRTVDWQPRVFVSNEFSVSKINITLGSCCIGPVIVDSGDTPQRPGDQAPRCRVHPALDAGSCKTAVAGCLAHSRANGPA
jgi:hypothetical protein